MGLRVRKKSRLAKYVLLNHTAGRFEELGFTASFTPLLIRFARKRDAVLPPGWYLVNKRSTRSTILVRPDDLTRLSIMDLAEIGRRMRMRAFKLIKSGRIRIDPYTVVTRIRYTPLLVSENGRVGVLELHVGGFIYYSEMTPQQLLDYVKDQPNLKAILGINNNNLYLVVNPY